MTGTSRVGLDDGGAQPAGRPLLPLGMAAMRRVARRLLAMRGKRPVGEWILRVCMLGYVLSPLSNAACIFPPALDSETKPPEPPANLRPEIVKGEPVDFLHGAQFSPAHFGDPWSFGVTAIDGDAISRGEQVGARLFLFDGTTYLPYADIPLSSTAAAPTTFTGQTLNAPWCRNIVATPNHVYPFYVFVSDQPFPASGSPADLVPGHFDSKYWEITCPGG